MRKWLKVFFMKLGQKTLLAGTENISDFKID